ncbi:MAG: hypothetical protein OXC14_04005 [Rhodospirillaceae bacterium]|nr:hypothetical protein [Rhodospirillaceae bacterium]
MTPNALTWVRFALTMLPLAGGALGIWWYVNDERDRSIDQVARLAEIRTEQEGIRKELATQSVLLTIIRDGQSEIDRNFDRINTEINRLGVSIVSEINRVHGQ